MKPIVNALSLCMCVACVHCNEAKKSESTVMVHDPTVCLVYVTQSATKLFFVSAALARP